MKRFLLFAAVAAAVIGLLTAGAVVALRDRIGDDGVRAIVMSAGIAFSLQCLTFGVAKAIMPVSVWTGWLATVVMRFLVVILHAVAGAPLLGLPLAPALLSLAGFILVTSVIEPFFLFDRSPLPPPASPPTAPPAT